MKKPKKTLEEREENRLTKERESCIIGVPYKGVAYGSEALLWKNNFGGKSKMKKALRLVALMLAIATLALTMLACGDDADKKNDSKDSGAANNSEKCRRR